MLMNSSGWFYGYNVDNPYRDINATGNCSAANATAHLDARFAPMNWCLDSIDTDVPAYVNHTFFLGFNEPNNAHNCNTDAATVAKAWARVMAKWPDSRLVSPATSGNGIEFFDAFFGNCTELYGPTGCNISYLAAHDYSCTPADTMAYLQSLYDRYHLPVWLTEFSCGDHATGRPTALHIEFMRGVLPLLDSADYVRSNERRSTVVDAVCVLGACALCAWIVVSSRFEAVLLVGVVMAVVVVVVVVVGGTVLVIATILSLIHI